MKCFMKCAQNRMCTSSICEQSFSITEDCGTWFDPPRWVYPTGTWGHCCCGVPIAPLSYCFYYGKDQQEDRKAGGIDH